MIPTETKVKFKTIEWKFRETTVKYPELSQIPKKKITSPAEFFELFKPILKEEPFEIFLVAWLK